MINKETFPKFKILQETEFIKDKSCIICFKSDMNLEDLSRHLERKHLLLFYEDVIIEDELEDWIYCAKKWDDAGLVYVESDNEQIEIYEGEEQYIDSELENFPMY